MNKHHQKHAKLPRPAGGDWGRAELSLLGAPCPVINSLVQQLAAHASPSWKIGYADASHGEEYSGPRPAAQLTVNAEFSRIDCAGPIAPYAQRQLFNDCDLVLVNGNHFTAQRQIVLLHPGKSLEAKLDRLSDVVLVVRCESAVVPEFLAPAIAGAPVLEWNDAERINAFFEAYLLRQAPALNGLVLSGGRSLRMGSDKSLLRYHGRPQQEHVFDLLRPLCSDVFVSCNAEQAAALELPHIADRFLGIGPLGGLLTALQSAPDRAWLTVACDMPYLHESVLACLVSHRDPSKLATTFRNPERGFPEPLVTIWEPRAYPVLLQALAAGITCPRKVLMFSDIALLDAPDPDALQNVNDAAACRDAQSRLANHSLTNPS